MPKINVYITQGATIPQSRHMRTTDPLPSNGTWTSISFPVSNHFILSGAVYADKAGTLYIEQSADGTNWDVSSRYKVPADDGRGFEEEMLLHHARVRYVNGLEPQTSFRLHFLFR